MGLVKLDGIVDNAIKFSNSVLLEVRP